MRTPLISLTTISGRDTCSSKPSRRIISIRIASCSSPRPSTLNCSGVSVGSTRSDTLPSSSFSSRSFRWRDVTYWPSRPASGEVLMPKIIDTVGSSTAMWRNRAPVFSGSAMVSPMVMSSMPARQMMSPADGFLDLDALQAFEREQLGDARLLRSVPSSLQTTTGSLRRTLAVEDAADGDAAEVVAGIEVRHQHLQRRVDVAARRRHVR